jgi:pimeloyl-ACP methyl ester carboxylesterase
MSGPVAVRVGLEMPDVVTRLILVSSILPSSGRPKAKSEERLQQRELDVLKLRGVEAWAKELGLFDASFVGNMFRRNPNIEPLWRRMIARHDAHRILCMLNARLNTESPVDWRSRLKDIKQNTLVIAGAKDTRFLDASRHLTRDIPNARLEIISGAGHMVNLEEVERFNEVVMEFLGS